MYEKRFNYELGFKGGNKTDDGSYNPDDPLYYSSYGNLTGDLLEQRAADAIA